MSMPDWEEEIVDGSAEVKHTILKPWVRHQSQAKRRYLFGAGSSGGEPQPLNTDNARVLVQCDGYLNLIDARYLNEVAGKVRSYKICLGYHIQECRIDLTEMLVSPGW